MERNEIETFLTLAQELHFGRTARRLQLSTSRVSQTIRQLERRVGAPLFRRTSRQVQLTPIGRRLAADLGPAWLQVQEGIQRAVDAGRGLAGTLTVGFVGPAASQLVARAATVFQLNSPDCEVVLREARTLAVTEWLRSGDADLALTVAQAPSDQLVHGPALVREAVVVALPSAHPYARRPRLTATDLSGTRLLRLEGMPELAAPRAGLEAAAAEPVATLGEALALVGQGHGLLPVGAHVMRYHPRPDITYRVVDDQPHLEWRLCWLRERETARVRAFVETANEVVAE